MKRRYALWFILLLFLLWVGPLSGVFASGEATGVFEGDDPFGEKGMEGTFRDLRNVSGIALLVGVGIAVLYLYKKEK